MPEIKPFCGIRPNPNFAGEVVLDIENLSLDEAKIIRQENPYSYVNMLVPRLDNLFLRGSKNELAFKKINENFEDFLEKGVLIRDQNLSLYVYRVSRGGNAQTGIWTLTFVDDYLSNKIKKHELTRPDREIVLMDYLQQTGIDANPVLVTYKPVAAINDIIDKVCLTTPDLSFSKGGALHQLWKSDERTDIDSVVIEFSRLPSAYIADGHHRAAAAALLAIKQRKLNPKHAGNEEYNFFTTVYMATDQLHIYPFHRLIKSLNGKSNDTFLKELRHYFKVGVKQSKVIPDKIHQFGMYFNGLWYELKPKLNSYIKGDSVSELDVTIVQDNILKAILNIQDSRTDPGISFAGGFLPLDDLIRQVDEGEFCILLVLHPTSIDQLIKVADQGGIMPPKSTWFEPKFQAGLLVHKID